MRKPRSRSGRWSLVGAVVVAGLAGSVTAWRASAAPGSQESTVVAVTPTRILDTRDPTDLGLPGPFVSAVSQDLKVTGSVVPTGATGVLMNVTVVLPTAKGFISIRPADAPGLPTTSSLNFEAGVITANAVQVNLPTSGADAGAIEITYDAYGTPGPTTDILIDVVGYTTNQGLHDLATDLAAKANAADVYPKTQTYSKAEVDAAIAASPGNALLAAGAVAQNGTVLSGYYSFGNFTVLHSQSDPGAYWLRLPGYGCTRPIPVVQLTALGLTVSAGLDRLLGVVGTNCDAGTGDLAIHVLTYEPTGPTFEDTGFVFTIYGLRP